MEEVEAFADDGERVDMVEGREEDGAATLMIESYGIVIHRPSDLIVHVWISS